VGTPQLLAVWAVAVLRSRPTQTPFQMVELGPGRGTLMVDILRVYWLRLA